MTDRQRQIARHMLGEVPSAEEIGAAAGEIDAALACFDFTELKG